MGVCRWGVQGEICQGRGPAEVSTRKVKPEGLGLKGIQLSSQTSPLSKLLHTPCMTQATAVSQVEASRVIQMIKMGAEGP